MKTPKPPASSPATRPPAEPAMTTISWHYHRPGCTTCKKMQAFLDERGIESTEVVNATKEKRDAAEAWKILGDLSEVVIARGKSVATFDPAEDDKDAILKKAMGPTGNLRAPTIVVGETAYIGFHEDEFAERIG